MKTAIVLAFTLASLSVPTGNAYAAEGGLLDFKVATNIKGFSRPRDLTQACLIAAAVSRANVADPKATVEWCARAAAHLWSLYPRDIVPGEPEAGPGNGAQPATETD
jgi:hypothetical protein